MGLCILWHTLTINTGFAYHDILNVETVTNFKAVCEAKSSTHSATEMATW